MRALFLLLQHSLSLFRLIPLQRRNKCPNLSYFSSAPNIAYRSPIPSTQQEETSDAFQKYPPFIQNDTNQFAWRYATVSVSSSLDSSAF
ncbi:unnamed protein product [Periconia digitata]|uniref:Uncharacterized protein n=1 Tax=Periconia digitata TaxID=1303443 RepID=A0A9W4XVD6_9PLEO|nr:unnamed protein product [Periconia digitata]